MTDDLFLKLWYFGTATMSLLMGVVIYLALRSSLARLTLDAWSGAGARFMGRLLLLVMMMSSFAGFLSVSMTGCDHEHYEEIVDDRAYVLRKVRDQASGVMRYAGDAVLFFSVVVTLLLLRGREGERRGRDRERAPGHRAE